VSIHVTSRFQQITPTKRKLIATAAQCGVSGLRKEVFDKPVTGQLGHLVQGAGFFEEMGSSRDDDELFRATQFLVGSFIKRDDRGVLPSNDE
jgi:hypothetical protein